jgi:tetratricopeptide (TPR) repeat protein
MALTNISSVYALQNKLAESLTYDERGLAILERALDPDHPQVGMQLNNMCSTRVSMKDYEAALSDCTRGLAIYEKTLGPNHPRIAYPLTGIGASLIGTNHPDRAVPVLERAVALRDANTSDPFDKAETYFQLARALRASGGDKKRARTLATKARDGYASAGDMGRTELAEVDAWLKGF